MIAAETLRSGAISLAASALSIAGAAAGDTAAPRVVALLAILLALDAAVEAFGGIDRADHTNS